MRKRLSIVVGLIAILIVAATVGVKNQPFNTQIQIALNQLTTGVIPFTAFRTAAGSYLNWGTTQGTNGYGIRDASGTMQVKSSGGTWENLGGGGSGSTTASYWTRVPEAALSNETALSLLGTAILLNTTATGVPVAYAGTSCTNQFVRSLDAVGAATCATVALLTDTSGTLTVARGGTGLTGGTDGGILGFTAAGTLASSGVLTVNQLLIGGGAGATPTALGSLGTTVSVLHGNAAGAPTFGAVSLTQDVSGTLPSGSGGTGSTFFAVAGPAATTKTYTFPNANSIILTDQAVVTAAQGGTGQTTYAVGDLLQATAATTLSKLAAVATGNALISGGVTTASSWGKIGLTTHVTGTLGPTNGGTGFAAYTTGDLLYANSGISLARLNDVAVGSILVSGGVATAPAYSTTPTVTSLYLGGAAPGTPLAGAISFVGIINGSLGTPTNGTIVYCSDCMKATPCAGGGMGALAKRLNGAWDCD